MWLLGYTSSCVSFGEAISIHNDIWDTTTQILSPSAKGGCSWSSRPSDAICTSPLHHDLGGMMYFSGCGHCQPFAIGPVAITATQTGIAASWTTTTKKDHYVGLSPLEFLPHWLLKYLAVCIIIVMDSFNRRIETSTLAIVPRAHPYQSLPCTFVIGFQWLYSGLNLGPSNIVP